MPQLVGAARGVPMDEHPNAGGQPAGDVHLVATEQGRVRPTEGAGSDGGVLCGEVGCGGEDRTGDLSGGDTVGLDQQREQLAGRFEDRLAGISLARCCAAQPSTNDGHSTSLLFMTSRRGVKLGCLTPPVDCLATEISSQREATKPYVGG